MMRIFAVAQILNLAETQIHILGHFGESRGSACDFSDNQKSDCHNGTCGRKLLSPKLIKTASDNNTRLRLNFGKDSFIARRITDDRHAFKILCRRSLTFTARRYQRFYKSSSRATFFF